MWTLTFPRPIPPADLYLRVMGPDRDGAYYWVNSMVVDHDGTTRATVVPLPPGETRLVVGEHGQDYVAESAVETIDGVARLMEVER